MALLLAIGIGGPAWVASAEPRPGPMFVRQGDRIVVPGDSPLRARLSTEPVASKSDPHDVNTPGVVEADPARTTNVVPPLTGRLLELKAGLGDTVARGQVLAVIGSPDLAQAAADVDKSRDALALARLALDRARGVELLGANATRDVEAARSNFNQASAEDGRAQARLRTLVGSGSLDPRSRLLTVRSPISGTVVSLNVGSGAFINDPNATLMTVANVDRVWITAQVPENLLGGITRGQPVRATLNAYPDQPLAGTVRFISPVLEPDTRRAKVRIEFANREGRLKPNMFATVSFAVAAAAAVTVPTSALLMNNDATTVLVEVAPWTFARRVVETGAEDGDKVRIVRGLVPGERVVTRGGILLND